MLDDLLSGRTQKLPVELPRLNKPVLAILQHWHTKNQRYSVLKHVDESDHVWQLDDCEISHDWDVISWMYLPELVP